MVRKKIAIIGMGYVGLPLAIEFGKHRQVIGYDKSVKKIRSLETRSDPTCTVSEFEFSNSKYLKFTTKKEDIADCEIYIVAVPTPIDNNKKPDLNPLIEVSEIIGSMIAPGDIVIYESTVYPGVTEEVCVPVLEKVSKLLFNKDFYCGYSPERINPGDKDRTIRDIIKVTSGSTPKVTQEIDALYGEIIDAGTFATSSIKVAEAAKVIENAQRDVNIAFVNELSQIFRKLNLDTKEVLTAAGTKWNFLDFRPGLVGGHCIGVDPYYLIHKALEVDHHCELTNAARRINDTMPLFAASEFAKLLFRKRGSHKEKVLVLGVTFKEDCGDCRNSKCFDIIRHLEEFGITVDAYDPIVDAAEVRALYNFSLKEKPDLGSYSGIILAVPHKEILKMGLEKIKSFGKPNHIFFDLKSIFEKEQSDLRL